MSRNVHIREAMVGDIDGLIPLLKELFSIEADFSFNEDLQRRGLEMMLKQSESRCMMAAFVDNQVIGMASIQTIISTVEGGIAGIVEDVVVAPAWRSKRIGSGLLKAIEEWAFKKGLKRIQLLADIENVPALEFYKHLGWTSTQLICLRKKDFSNERSWT